LLYLCYKLYMIVTAVYCLERIPNGYENLSFVFISE
jgi:hypothetical protein